VTAPALDPAALLGEWEELSAVLPGDRQFRSRRLPRPTLIDLRVGLRENDSAPCLIVVIPEGSEQIATFETSGLRLFRSVDDAGALLVLSLEEPSRRDLFAQICSDVVLSLVRSEDEGERDLLYELSGRLAAWRMFLRDQSDGLDRHEVVGLIGELLVLDRLLDRSSDALGTWKSPDDGLHDFERRGSALEVKTSLGSARRVHISAIDQLDASGLRSLNLAHVRLIERTDGLSVIDAVDRIEARLTGDRDRREFRNALLRRGLAPNADQKEPRVECVGIEIYVVSNGFPCLTGASIPVGISEVVYDIDVRSLAPFATDADGVLDKVGGSANV
jgi:hypothetical protein